MIAKKFLLTACSLVFAFCLTLGLLNVTHVNADNTSETGWVFERTDANKYSTGNYRCVQLLTTYASAPQFNGTEAFWGFSVKNHLETEAMIRFGFPMGGGATVWMGGVNSVYYLVDSEGKITKLQGVAGQNIKVPGNFDGIVFWNPSEGYNYETESVATNKYRVKGIQVGYDFRSAYLAKLEFSKLYVADFTVTDGTVELSTMTYKGNLDVLDGNPKWINLGSPSGEGLAAMTNGTTISQIELNPGEEDPIEYVSLTLSDAITSFEVGDTFSYEGLVVKGTTADGETHTIPTEDCTVDFSQVNLQEAGEYNVTVSFGDISAVYTVTVTTIDPTEDYVVSIEVDGANCKYVEGDVYDDTFTVKAVYNSGKKLALDKGEYQVDSSAVNTAVAGEYPVIVTSGEFSCEYNVKVYDSSWIFYNRLNNQKVDGNTYHGAYFQTDSAEGTPLGDQRYIGIRVKNLLPYTNTRIRFGFTYNNGTARDMFWLFGSGTYYTVDAEGNIDKNEITGQYLFVKPNFEGWIFVDTMDSYGKERYQNEALMGTIIGYDFRSTYTCSLGVNSIGAADFTDDGTTITMSGFRTLAYFGDMDITNVEQDDINGSPSAEQYQAAVACISFNKVPGELITEENVTALEMFVEPTKKEYTTEDASLDLKGGVAIATYTMGEYTIQQRFNLSDLTISGFTAGVKGEQTVTFGYADKTLSYTITVKDEGDLIPVGITIKTLPTKLEYLVNEQADWSGGVVTITFESGKTEDVGFDDERLNIVGFSTLSAREGMSVYITVAGDATIFDTFKVDVTKPGAEDNSSTSEQKQGCTSSVNGATMLMGVIALAIAVVCKKRKES